MPKRPLSIFVLLGLVLLACQAQATRLDDQRAAFLQAEKALQRGAVTEYRRLSATLTDYPLYPYLRYQALSGRLDKASKIEVKTFLDTYADTPLADLLRADWLDRLGKEKRWRDYLAFYRPTGNVSRQCYRLRALIATGKADEALPEVAGIWLHGRSRPSACDPVFAAWQKAGHLTRDLRWKRIEKAMEVGEWRLAEYLGKGLSDGDRVWLKRWVRLYRQPAAAEESGPYDAAHPYREAMLSHAVRHLARWDGEQALRLWQTIRTRYPFNDRQLRRTEQYLLRNLVRAPGDEAYRFIRSVQLNENDLRAHDARIRAALFREDWPQVIRWIAALPSQERNDERWTYWLARAFEATGDSAAADKLYEKVAGERSYYGFLAADRSGRDYHLLHAETPVSAALAGKIEKLDGIRRASELFALERWTEARREWREATAGMDADGLKAAAKLAERRGWHDRAIFTLARTGFWDDLELRFPLEHIQTVEENARKQGIDIAWVFAVMRQESAFMHNARSSAGAMGLMQLMPATAKHVAKKVLKQTPPRRRDLFEPDTNIALGSAYLKQVKSELGDSAVLATAAYNAGPHRVTRWLPQRTLPGDIWIELVPFQETRSYLRRVLAYTVIYEKRMGLEPTRLHDRLHPVPPSVGLIGGSQPTGATASAG